jgi:hypothetical protein
MTLMHKQHNVANITALVLLAIGATNAVTILFSYANRRRGISFEHYQQIKEGMTKRQVEAILEGGPRWDVDAADDFWIEASGPRPAPDEWWGIEGVISVYFVDNIVVEKRFGPHRCPIKRRSLWTWLQSWTW